MNDRLGDLGSGAHWADSDDEMENNNTNTGNGNGNGNTDGGDIEMGAKPQQQAKHMEHFFREVESIKDDIDQVKRATKMIGDINESALHATTTDEENELSNRLRPLVDQTNKRAKRTKTLLGLLKEESKKLKDGGTAKACDLRCVRSCFLCFSRSINFNPFLLCVSMVRGSRATQREFLDSRRTEL